MPIAAQRVVHVVGGGHPSGKQTAGKRSESGTHKVTSEADELAPERQLDLLVDACALEAGGTLQVVVEAGARSPRLGGRRTKRAAWRPRVKSIKERTWPCRFSFST